MVRPGAAIAQGSCAADLVVRLACFAASDREAKVRRPRRQALSSEVAGRGPVPASTVESLRRARVALETARRRKSPPRTTRHHCHEARLANRSWRVIATATKVPVTPQVGCSVADSWLRGELDLPSAGRADRTGLERSRDPCSVRRQMAPEARRRPVASSRRRERLGEPRCEVRSGNCSPVSSVPNWQPPDRQTRPHDSVPLPRVEPDRFVAT